MLSGRLKRVISLGRNRAFKNREARSFNKEHQHR